LAERATARPKEARLVLPFLQIMTCPRCSHGYEFQDGDERESSSHSRIPRVLSCGHSLCSSCLSQLICSKKSFLCLCCYQEQRPLRRISSYPILSFASSASRCFVKRQLGQRWSSLWRRQRQLNSYREKFLFSHDHVGDSEVTPIGQQPPPRPPPRLSERNEDDDTITAQKIITLRSADNQYFQIQTKVALLSQVIRDELQG
jgi:hypothetical protein